jgi:acetyl-CoA carboxylase carboxyl transferase subunit beta
MNWLTNWVRPKISELVGGSKDIPEDMWHKCPSCEQMIFHRDLEKNQKVCQHCGHHLRLSVDERLGYLFDEGRYQTVELPDVAFDPLKFRDLKKYTDRLKDSQKKTGRKDALTVAHGTIGGNKVVVAAFDFAFMGGSMGAAVGAGLVRAAELATIQEAALIAVPASGGARMQEGIVSLMQLAKTTIAVEIVREAGLPYIVLLTDPTTGGVSASFAMLGDIQIAEPGALIGFAGARVIEQTIREKLPEGFQSAEYLLDHGMVDMVVHRHDLSGTLGRIIDLLRNPGPVADVVALSEAGKGEQTEPGKGKGPQPTAPIPHGAVLDDK